MAAGTIANEHNITAYALDRTYEATVASMIEIREKVIRVNRSDYPSMLADFINRNMANILVIKDGKVTMEPRGPIVARIVSEESLVQVSKAELKKFLAERKISTREFEADMRARGKLIDDKKGRLTTGWKNAISVDPAYLYWFKTELPTELIDDSDS